MEKLKNSRKQYRRLFTIAHSDFLNCENDLTIEDKILKLKIVEEKAKLMVASEYEFRELLFASEETEENINNEIDISESYIDKWRILENKLHDLLDEKKEHSSVSTVSGAVSTTPSNLLHYPKINLPTFDGNIRNWLWFWGQFQKIDNDSNLDNHDKYAYLAHAMEKGSPADELIKSFSPGGENYEKAVKQLKLRYGREELLVEVYVRDLLSIVLLKQKLQKIPIRKLYDQLETKLRALETLGVTKDKYAAMLFPLVESSLPDETLKAWERFRTTHRRVSEEVTYSLTTEEKDTSSCGKMPSNDLDRLLDFLQDEVEGEERIVLASQSFDQPKKSSFSNSRRESNEKKFQTRVSSATDLLASNLNKKKLCIFCTEEHNSWNCKKASKLTLHEKQSAVEKARCCFLCLREGHGVKTCRSKFNCQLCGKKHHLFLCRALSPEPNSSSVPTDIKVRESMIQHDEALANLSKCSNVFLQTLTILVRGETTKRKARAIIDSGSQRSYILKATAEEMNYKAKRREYLQHSLFGGSNTSTCQHDVYMIYLSSVSEEYSCHFEVLGQEVICDSILSRKRGSHFKELRDYNIHLVEDLDGPIEILIGADVAGKLITGNHLQLKNGITAIETKLDWTVIGRANSENTSLLITSMLTTSACITDLWTLDSLGITDPSEKKTAIELQEAARQHFLDTVKIENNRYIVSLPWIEDHLPLPDNFELSEKRLHKVVKRLKTEGLFEAYGAVFKEWLEEDIIEEVTKDEVNLPAHYLPHRPVLKQNSTTKIRPVFDASARQKGAPCLNDCLETGVNLIELIPNILYRFRLEKIGVIADIRKAFLQVCLSPSDKDFLRSLWIGEDGKLKYFRHCRVVFSVSCSPFLLGIVIMHHLQEVLNHQDKKYPERMVKLLMQSFYVDNCVTSVPNEKELELFIEVATNVMAERSFQLRGWESTCLKDRSAPVTNVLGLQWDKGLDTLGINMNSLKELCVENVTKKTILSAAHRIFDPIGATCPVALFPKLLYRKLGSEN
ncbi:uncharacterized protein LOC129962308 [Argiope bruennichi]|uniref:uncharacterized protein LOC129962308 n=1 Tax=Argiope bruennichi TaxID=94029 RepID=UPI0024940D4D|nr:uncharacterized protein LOC129962308 [Argiope bruennichi]